jgi:hypothetical protein
MLYGDGNLYGEKIIYKEVSTFKMLNDSIRCEISEIINSERKGKLIKESINLLVNRNPVPVSRISEYENSLFGDILYNDKKLYGKIVSYYTNEGENSFEINMLVASGVYDTTTDSINSNVLEKVNHFDKVTGKINKELINPLDWKNYIEKIPNWKGVD